MPWRVTSPMYQRQRFVLDAEHTPASFAELCRRYGVSRKTGYKWLDRYERLGPDSLADRSHRPQQCPHATAPAVIREILQLRKAWRWGARKLHERWGSGGPPRSTRRPTGSTSRDCGRSPIRNTLRSAGSRPTAAFAGTSAG